jgi:hypothetical protein
MDSDTEYDDFDDMPGTPPPPQWPPIRGENQTLEEYQQQWGDVYGDADIVNADLANTGHADPIVPADAAEHPNGIAYQIHNKYKEIPAAKVYNFLTTKDPTDYSNTNNIVEFIKPILLNVVTSYDTPQINDTQKLDDILEKLNNATTVRDDITNKNFIGKIVTFVKKLPPNFQIQFIQGFITECSTAYGNVNVYNSENISCTKGIVERFITTLGNTARNICMLDEKNCITEYKDIMEAFVKQAPIIDIPNLFEEWSQRLETLDPSLDAKRNFINFVSKKMTFEQKVDAAAKYNSVNQYIEAMLEKAPLYESYYKSVFQNKQLGGKRIRRSLKKRKTKTKKRFKKTKKRFKKTKTKKRSTKKRE